MKIMVRIGALPPSIGAGDAAPGEVLHQTAGLAVQKAQDR